MAIMTGILSDINLFYLRWTSDWRFSSKALSAGIFAFVAQAFPAITFANLLSDRTKGELGVVETLLGMALCGLLFALAAGQPLVLVGTTGPVCILLATIFDASIAWGVAFKGLLFFTCVWSAVFHIVLALTGVPRLFVDVVTPFSGDIFGCLVSVIYVIEGVISLEHLSRSGGGSSSSRVSVGLGVGVCLCALALSNVHSYWLKMRGENRGVAIVVAVNDEQAIHNDVVTNKEGDDQGSGEGEGRVSSSNIIDKEEDKCQDCDSLPPSSQSSSSSSSLSSQTTTSSTSTLSLPTLRLVFCDSLLLLLSDYSLAISVLLMVAIQYSPGVIEYTDNLPRLVIPTGLLNSSSSSSWLVSVHRDINTLPSWAAAAAAGPGAMLTALLLFDHQISAMLSQRPEFGLKLFKPSYDYDFFLLGLSLLLTGTLGLPPVYGLLPQAPLHVRALGDIRQPREGEGSKEVWVSVFETRWSAVLQSLLLLIVVLSPELLSALQSVPQGVLGGILVFLGIAGLTGNGVVERTKTILVKIWSRFCGRLGGDTSPITLPFIDIILCVLQWILVFLVFGISISPAALAFPIVILLLVPLRRSLLPYLLGTKEMEASDPSDWSAGVSHTQE